MGSGAQRKSQSNYVKANDKNYFDGDVDARTVESVSVTRLCKTADINRSTFYAHYIDILM